MAVFRRRRGHPLLSAFNIAAGQYYVDDAELQAYYFDDAETLPWIAQD